MNHRESSPELSAVAEQIDAWATAAEARAASPEVIAACGLDVIERDDAVAVMASSLDVLAFNRVINFGMKTPARAETLDAFKEFYRAAGVPRFFVQLSPAAQPENIEDILIAGGLRHYNNWAKLIRSAEPPPEVNCDLRIEELGVEHADAFGKIVANAFEFGDDIAKWLASLVGKPGFTYYGAFDGEKLVAGAGMYVRDGAAWLGYAGTDMNYRKHGAQSALIARRIEHAREEGCRWLVTETAEDKPERHNPSYHNMLRMGFELLYLRPNYTLSPAS